MALSLGVKVKASSTGGASSVATGAVTTVNQRTIVVISTGGSVNINGVSGTIGGSPDGNTYTEIGTAQSNTAKMRMWVCENANGGASHVFTFTYSGTEFPAVFAFQIAAGSGMYAALDGPGVTAQASDSTQPYTVTSGSTTVADTFVIGAIASSDASTSNGGITGTINAVAATVGDTDTNAAQIWPGGWIYKIQTVQTTQALSMTVGTQPANESTVVKVVAFKEVAAATGGTLTGSSATASRGAVAPSFAAALAGLALAMSAGTVSVGSDVSVALSGQSATASSGTIAPARSKALTGQQNQIFLGSFEAGGELGVHTLHGVLDGDGAGTETTSPITTQGSGSSFVWYEGGYTSNSAKPTDNKSNSTTVTGTPRAYNGFGGAFNFKYWVVENGSGGSGHTLSCVLNGQPAGEVVLGLIEIKGATALTDSTEDYPSSGSALTSTPVTVAGPATLIAIWTGDNPGTTNSATPGNGFSTIDDYTVWPPGETSVQTVVASREVTGAGSYGLTWTATPTQGAILTLLAFEHDGSGNAPTVSVAMSGITATAGQGGVSAPVALTGASATAAAGTAAPSASKGAVGNAATSAAGALAPSAAQAAAGSTASSSSGAVASETAIALSGAQTAAAAGTVNTGSDVSAAVTGSASTASAGTVRPERSVPLSGQGATSVAGNVSAGSDVTAVLAGQSAAAVAGGASPTAVVSASGQQATATAGTVTTGADVAAALTGAASTTSAGIASSSLAHALAGESAAVADGTVTAASGYTAALAGEAVQTQAGTITAGISKALTGSDITATRGTVIGGNSNLPSVLIETVISNSGLVCVTVVTDLD
jgi:hypothetical protein